MKSSYLIFGVKSFDCLKTHRLMMQQLKYCTCPARLSSADWLFHSRISHYNIIKPPSLLWLPVKIIFLQHCPKIGVKRSQSRFISSPKSQIILLLTIKGTTLHNLTLISLNHENVCVCWHKVAWQNPTISPPTKFNYPFEHGFTLCSNFCADGSDWQQTDAEDQRSNKSQYRGSESTKTSQPGQNQEVEGGNPGNPALMLAGHQLPPVYIIKNMVLKQVRQV